MDYYFDNKDPELDNKKDNTNATKTLENRPVTARRTIKNTTSFTTVIENDDESKNANKYSEEHMKNTSKKQAFLSHNNFESDANQAEIGYNTNADVRHGANFVSKANSFEDIIKDYEYREDNAWKTYPMIRRKGKTTTARKPFDSNKIAIFQNTIDYENDEKLPVDFYNVIPATSTEKDFDYYAEKNQILNKKTWYVPEKSSCWDLPILYGEIGPLRTTSDVFLMYPGTLTNVKESDEEHSKPARSVFIPVEQTMNKWCAAGPCYGDHTMCLFSDKINSKLCKKGYTVFSPTVVERIGLVNTVNSMRNRIAMGRTIQYKHLPKAADMNQLIYDYDLENMAVAWLHQCLPGPAACSALDGNYVTQLECTKYVKRCCIDSFKTKRASKCVPHYECYLDPIIGCIYVWFWKAGTKLTTTDVKCGHITPNTFYTAQLLWAETTKIGCAYGNKPDGDVRVVCNFAPGAPFYIDSKYYCGFIGQSNTSMDDHKPKEDINYHSLLKTLGIYLTPIRTCNSTENDAHNIYNYSVKVSEVDILGKIFKRKWVRESLGKYQVNGTSHQGNGTISLVARLVTKYTFSEDTGSQCDMNDAIYESGEPGSKCVERGRRFHALCYDFRDPTPGYRLVAVVAPVALFSLILYDLFSGVVRQTNY
ncbi:hypothetical protein PYW08_005708 [Mythimna loreyi]|uniref:Uncharacterized protein n=1 Tax=Mythimna loreyi TaxID=667449 RepID=A0ACC2QJC8_9NEOP|nr:hypothetical protein PYW08_005708 [Mythimna loreyi]